MCVSILSFSINQPQHFFISTSLPSPGDSITNKRILFFFLDHCKRFLYTILHDFSQ